MIRGHRGGGNTAPRAIAIAPVVDDVARVHRSVERELERGVEVGPAAGPGVQRRAVVTTTMSAFQIDSPTSVVNAGRITIAGPAVFTIRRWSTASTTVLPKP